MLKLLIRNKIVEMANAIHFLWTDGELLMKYCAIMILTLPIMPFIWYNVILHTTASVKDPITLIIFAAVIYHIGSLVFLCIMHAIILKFIEWIKHNIEIAKRNEKVTPNWKR
jgi:hypothetical protein